MGDRKKSKKPSKPTKETPDENHLKVGMLAMLFMGLPSLPEKELAKRTKMAEKITGK